MINEWQLKVLQSVDEAAKPKVDLPSTKRAVQDVLDKWKKDEGLEASVKVMKDNDKGSPGLQFVIDFKWKSDRYINGFIYWDDYDLPGKYWYELTARGGNKRFGEGNSKSFTQTLSKCIDQLDTTIKGEL